MKMTPADFERLLKPINCRLPSVRPILNARHSIGSNPGFFSEFSYAPANGRARHAELDRLHWYGVQMRVDIVYFRS